MRWVKLSIFSWLFLILHYSHYWKVILLYYTACIQIDTISPCFKLSRKTHNLVELVEMYYLFQLIRDLIYWTYIVLAAQIVISCWSYILPPILYEWFWERYYYRNAFCISLLSILVLIITDDSDKTEWFGLCVFSAMS